MDNSTIFYLKSKFFLYRALSYFSFLLVPVWVQKSIDLNDGFQALLMVFYIMFMVGQWFLLGKEIDHRLKIYYKVNSSMDRVVYRFILGMTSTIILFNLFSLIPKDIVKHFFWGTWVILGLFYSWPTRGKIITESVSTELGEFKFLDSFEKTIIGLIVILLIISIPDLPVIDNKDSLKLYFDPMDKFSPQFWNFMAINYFPFKKFDHLMSIAWSMHFYIVGVGLYLLSFYALLRYFVSRRLSILGVFAIISSWSFSKILGNSLGLSISSTYSTIWVWSMLWIARSSTYRTGLIVGFLGYLGTVLNPSFYILMFVQFIQFYFIYFKEKNFWFKRNVFRYASLGFILATATFIGDFDALLPFDELVIPVFLKQLQNIYARKAFFFLSFFGVAFIVLKYLMNKSQSLSSLKLPMREIDSLMISLSTLFIFSFFVDVWNMEYFSLMWPVTLLSLLPLDTIFQSISRLRSRRNMIFAAYILICLLDSHVEGRVKIFLRLFTP